MAASSLLQRPHMGQRRAAQGLQVVSALAAFRLLAAMSVPQFPPPFGSSPAQASAVNRK